MGTRALLLNFAVWTLIGAFQASTWMLAPATVGSAHPARFLAVALFNAYVWALLTPMVFRLGTWVNRERESRLRRVLLIVALGLALSAVVTVMAFAVHRLLLPVPPSSGGQVSQAVRAPGSKVTSAPLARPGAIAWNTG